MKLKQWLPGIVAVLMAVWYVGTMRPPAAKTYTRPEFAAGYEAFGRLPLVFGGRVQPLDSLARNSLLQLREKQTVNLEPWKDWYDKPKIIPAIEWLATVMMSPAEADAWPVFRIDHPELISLLKLPQKDRAMERDGKHYSWNDIQPALAVMDSESKRIGGDGTEQNKGIASDLRTPFERAVMKMHERLVLYMRLKNTLQPQDAKDWPKELADFQAMIPAGIAAAKAQQANEKYDEAVFARFLDYVQKFDLMARFEPPLLIPPAGADHSRGQWMRAGEALLEAPRSEMPKAVVQYAAISGAFNQGDAARFTQAVADYQSSLAPGFAAELSKSGHELFFNRLQAFYGAMVIYVLAFLLACGSWFNLSNLLRRTAVWLIGLAFVIHTTGLIYRMWLEGRPPVTNLYSSAIFIGWGAVILGLVLERFYKDGIGAVVAASMGFITLIIAHNLSLGGDTMEMMRAVLDTNFWLATHVVIVTLGYASTFVAGFLAILYVILGVFTPRLSQPLAQQAAVTASATEKSAKKPATAAGPEFASRALTRMIYGIVCFATLFSFVGTVLGGIWADQSWGRFWGWDPKENGALIIVLWNALILHLRWGGMIRERGLVNCALVGNIVTSWSWFGVNMLGIGLHSYGFMDAAFKWLMLFIASQLILIGLGLVPTRYWASFKNSPPPSPRPPTSGATATRAVSQVA